MEVFSKIYKIIQKTFLPTVFAILFSITSIAQKNECFGAYYFDGWTGVHPYHITKSLVDSFSERESKWGWITSSQEFVDEQIDEAANANLSFFSFCWYYTGASSFKKEPLNRALSFFINSTHKQKLKYCLLVVNNTTDFSIKPSDWPIVVDEWITNLRDGNYLTVDGKPLMVFYSISSLIQTFGSTSKVKFAFDSLRNVAIGRGLKGVTIAACLEPDSSKILIADSCGVDILTGYNYHGAGFNVKGQKIPIDSLRNGEQRAWNRFLKYSSLKYIPVSTLNWDPRPWANDRNQYNSKPYYVGYSGQSVYSSIVSCKNWLNTNSGNTTKEKIAFLYAWNEYGEGAWLTPTKTDDSLLKGVKKALTENSK